jgi:hypothetical protein
MLLGVVAVVVAVVMGTFSLVIHLFMVVAVVAVVVEQD